MKKIFLLLATLATLKTGQAQTTETYGETISERIREKNIEKANELYEEDETDKDFKIKKPIKDYSNESQVILCAKTSYNCEANMFESEINIKTHKRILLLDKKAIEEYSTIENTIVGVKGDIGIKIIKPNGETKFYCINDVIKVKEDNKNFFNTTIDKNFKLAISNLEIGDIIDYVINESNVFPKNTIMRLPNYYYPLQDEHPIVKQKLNFYIHKNYLFSFKSINGAGTLKQDEVDARKYRSFTFVDSNRESIKNTRWLYAKQEVPMIKFTFSQKALYNNYLDCDNFYNEDYEEARINITKDVVKLKAERFFKKYVLNVYNLKSEIRTNVKKYNDDTENKDSLLNIIYYSTKRLLSMPNDFINNANEKKYYIPNRYARSYNPSELNTLMNEKMNTLTFVAEVSKALANYDIKCSIVMAPNRRYANLEGLAFWNELEYAIKIKDKIIYAPNTNSNIYDGDENLEGAQGYEATSENGDFSEFTSFKPFTFPMSTTQNNVGKSILNVRIDESNFEKIILTDTSSYAGLQEEFKTKYITDKDLNKIRIDCKKVLKIKLEEEEEEENIENLSARKQETLRKKKEYAQQEIKNILEKVKKEAKENFPTVL
jgi:hypothetical protein